MITTVIICPRCREVTVNPSFTQSAHREQPGTQVVVFCVLCFSLAVERSPAKQRASPSSRRRTTKLTNIVAFSSFIIIIGD
jgi:hypothetical protein